MALSPTEMKSGFNSPDGKNSGKVLTAEGTAQPRQFLIQPPDTYRQPAETAELPQKKEIKNSKWAKKQLYGDQEKSNPVYDTVNCPADRAPLPPADAARPRGARHCRASGAETGPFRLPPRANITECSVAPPMAAPVPSTPMDRRPDGPAWTSRSAVRTKHRLREPPHRNRKDCSG